MGYQLLGDLLPGAQVNCVGTVQTANGTWYEIEYEGGKAYISSSVVKETVSTKATAAPTTKATATATPKATATATPRATATPTPRATGVCAHTSTVQLSAVPATCTESGLSNGVKCSLCGEILTPQTVINELGHDYVVHEAKAPTKNAIGWFKYTTCTRCDYTTYKERRVEPGDWSVWGWSVITETELRDVETRYHEEDQITALGEWRYYRYQYVDIYGNIKYSDHNTSNEEDYSYGGVSQNNWIRAPRDHHPLAVIGSLNGKTMYAGNWFFSYCAIMNDGPWHYAGTQYRYRDYKEVS